MISRRDYDALDFLMSFITTIVISFLIILGVIGIMAIGVLSGRGEIRGSCGGVAGGSCEICGNGSSKSGTSDHTEGTQGYEL